MKRTAILILSVISLSIATSSCSKYGCPGHISQQNHFDKTISTDEMAVSIYHTECIN